MVSIDRSIQAFNFEFTPREKSAFLFEVIFSEPGETIAIIPQCIREIMDDGKECIPTEIGMSECEYGCKVYKCSHGTRVIHSTVYGCLKGK